VANCGIKKKRKGNPFGLKIKETFAEMLVFSKIKEKMGGDFGFYLVVELPYHRK
jgi:long-subunit acyl-CoA synthetase (AMP-forming)